MRVFWEFGALVSVQYHVEWGRRKDPGCAYLCQGMYAMETKEEKMDCQNPSVKSKCEITWTGWGAWSPCKKCRNPNEIVRQIRSRRCCVQTRLEQCS